MSEVLHDLENDNSDEDSSEEADSLHDISSMSEGDGEDQIDDEERHFVRKLEKQR